ncbi:MULTISPECIES: SulP family inorganic anion transporter, partial [Fischerella]|uniref:SulP family inorganic anion transporter n=1 Tax=Fischerella TaxID=1190 RepID=UPI0011AF75E4
MVAATGGLSRSVVNFSANANTPLASMITALMIALTMMQLGNYQLPAFTDMISL